MTFFIKEKRKARNWTSAASRNSDNSRKL